MARKVGKRDSRYLAKLVIKNRAPCAFCHREVDDEVTYGKLYAIGDIQCHYFCALLSCCLVQKGPEEEGLFGFMYKDILAELERSKKHKCSFCSKGGANLGCSISSCRKQFHLPCGRDRNAVSLYYGTYKSFCQLHAPKQNIPEHIMSKAKLRMKSAKVVSTQGESTEDMVCVICYESVDAFPTVNTFWPPCCGKDAWFHRSCLQRMALSAGMHYLKCPLCNDKQNFYDAVIDQGYYVPDRDAAWELEQNAFAEIYERPLICTAETCECPLGRNHDADQGEWDIKLCLLCGSVGAHTQCIGASETTRYVCLTCKPAAPQDMQALADTIEKLIIQEQAATATTQRGGPLMPSRMSLRRTKGRPAIANRPSSSRSHDVKTECENTYSPQTIASRQELNLSTPRKFQPTKPDPYNSSPYKSRPLQDSHKSEASYKSIESFKRLKSPVRLSQNQNDVGSYKCMEAFNSTVKLYESLTKNNDSYKMDGAYSYRHEMDDKLASPMKLLEQSLNERVCMGVKDLDEEVVEMLRKKFRKPGPLSLKRKIIEDILDGLITNLNTSEKQKEQLREWCSPRKSCDITEEILPSEDTTNNTENTGVNKEDSIHETPKKSTRSRKNQSVEDSEGLSSDNNIDMNATKTKLGNNSEELDSKISEDKNDHAKDESVKTVESEERTSVAYLGVDIDDSSNSTFQLPPEYVADTQSDCSNASSITHKTIDAMVLGAESLKKDIEVESDDCKEVNDDVTTEDSEAKCAFKFSPLDKEKLDKNNVDISLESFKKSYLCEVGKEKCSFDKHGKGNFNLSSVIDYAVDAHLKEKVVKTLKRKHSEGKLMLVFNKDAKKRKLSEEHSNLSSSDDFEDKKEIKSPAPKKKEEKFKVKLLSKRNVKKRLKDKARKERKRLSRSQVHEKITIADNNMISEKKEKTVKETERYESISNPDDASDASNKTINKQTQINSNKTDIDKVNGPPKRKFQESSQWLAEITELDKKLEIEAKRKARKTERKFKKINVETSGKDKSLNMQEKYQNNKTDKQRLGTDRNCINKKFDEVKFKDTKEVTTKTNGNSRDGDIRKEKNRKHKQDKLSRQQKRQRRLDKKYKKDMKQKENYEDSKQNNQNIELTIDSSEKTSKNKKNKMKTKLSIRNNEKDISVKIKWKKKQLRLKIKESKKEKIKKMDNDHSKFKQYVLQYFSEITPKEVLVKPEKDVGPLKRKYVKQEKSPDKLKQMSIQSFFKTKSPN